MLWIWYRIEPLISPYPQALDRYCWLTGRLKKNISAKDRVDYLYSVLGILDTKASSLMTFDGIVLAVLAIVAKQHPVWVLIISLLVLISMMLCLWVAAIMWRFLAEKSKHQQRN